MGDRKDSLTALRDRLFSVRTAVLQIQEHTKVNATMAYRIKTWLLEYDAWLLEFDARRAGPDSLLPTIDRLGKKKAETDSLLPTIDRLEEKALMSIQKGFGFIEEVIESTQRFYKPPSQLEETLAKEHLVDPLNKVREMLKSDNENTKFIGIVGISGMGKTTILKEIRNDILNNTISSPKEFDFIIWVRVHPSRTNSNMIQFQILRELGFADHLLNGTSQEDRSSCIFQNLSTSNFLLLLDGVWEPLNFSEIGLPLSSPAKSKIIFTTTSIDNPLYHGAGDSDMKMVELKGLSVEEGYELFVRTVREINPIWNVIDIPPAAKSIVELCNGVPLAIIFAGRLLCGKVSMEWEDIKDWLNEYASHYDPLNLNIFLDRLIEHKGGRFWLNQELKLCFIYIALFPEDSAKTSIQLNDYFIVEERTELQVLSYLRYYDTIEELLQMFHLPIVASLQHHGKLRGYALWLTNKDHFLYSYAGECLTEEDITYVQWREAKRISLMDNQIEQLSISPECPNLLTLILCKNPLTKIDQGFFQFMPSLRVLDLSWCKIGEIPKGIVDLVTLQYLNLSHTDIAILPIEFKNLVNLRVLDLSYMNELYAIPREVLSSLGSLEAFNTFRSCPPRNLIMDDGELLVGSMEFLQELYGMHPRLIRLGISIKDFQALKILYTFSSLNCSMHSLLIVSCEGLPRLELSSLEFMPELNTLEIIDCEDLELISWQSRQGDICSFYRLLHLKIERCWSLEELTWLSHSPRLQDLYIERCMNLKVVIDDQAVEEIPPKTFCKLKTICLSTLPMLTCISQAVISFPSLEQITVSYCPELKKFPIKSMSHAPSLKVIRGQRKWWDSLEWEDESFKNDFLPHFEEIKSWKK